MARVNLCQVSKLYGQTRAVHDFSLEIKDREFVVLVGPSGCGKSTTLRMVAGLEEVTSGEIHIGNRLVNHMEPKDRNIAMVFQNYALYPHMSVYENMAFSLKMRKFPRAEIHRRVTEAAEILALGDLLKRKPRELSGGQRQRVALGRAIVRDPAVFLMDEPLSNLDAKLRTAMRTELSRLHQRLQTTTIYVTHDQVEAMTLGHRIVVMKDGVIQQVAPPQELYDRPVNVFVANLIGSPPMNLLEGLLSEDAVAFRFPGGEVALPYQLQTVAGPYAGKPVVLGVRPEDVQLGCNVSFADGQSQVRAVVEVVEPLGSEVLVHLDAGGQPLTARAEPNLRFGVGDKLAVGLSQERVHVFDSATQQAIRPHLCSQQQL